MPQKFQSKFQQALPANSPNFIKIIQFHFTKDLTDNPTIIKCFKPSSTKVKLLLKNKCIYKSQKTFKIDFCSFHSFKLIIKYYSNSVYLKVNLLRK